MKVLGAKLEISIHGSRVEPDQSMSNLAKTLERFQSTGPVWNPTEGEQVKTVGCQFQSTGPVWNPTLRIGRQRPYSCISIHGSRVEPDSANFC